MINECVKNDNKIINELSLDKKTFEINLDAIEDKSMEISQSNETVLDDVTNNALNFMLNM